MPSRELTFPVFDADNHMYESQEALTKFLPDNRKKVIDFSAPYAPFYNGIFGPRDLKVAAIGDIAGDFVYARLQTGQDSVKTAYPPKQLSQWAERLQAWADGGEPDDLPRVGKKAAKKEPRDVFAYIIHGGKVHAPAGAMELIGRVGGK